MKRSFQTRFTLGMIFIFIIILVLAVFSGYYLNTLSDKTGAILKENYLSVVYAREMTEGLVNIDKEITTSSLRNRKPDTLKIVNELNLIYKSLLSEKSNITEPGEGKLVAGIEADYSQYRDSVLSVIKSSKSTEGLLYLQEKSGALNEKLLLLSQMNGNAVEKKTDDAKAFSKSALTHMTVLATLCFLIGMGLTFSFSMYVNQKFFQLNNGIKEIVSSNYDQHLYFDTKDEFYEISLVFNEMVDKLRENERKKTVILHKDPEHDSTADKIEELRAMLVRIKNTETQASALIAKLENK